MNRIGLPLEGQEVVLSYEMTEEVYLQWKQLFFDDSERFFVKVAEDGNREQLVLAIYTRLAVEAQVTFCDKGVTDQIYYDTMKDFVVWYLVCVRKKGIQGLTEEKWLSLHIRGGIFQMGRLQFEPQGDRIHVHIPEGESLTPKRCEESFRMAHQFFPSHYQIFDCHSWLVSPALEELCEEGSNILHFKRRFQIEKVTHPFLQAEERVFGEVLENKAEYPEVTSLQRSLKAYILQGKEPGMGYGIIDRKNI